MAMAIEIMYKGPSATHIRRGHVEAICLRDPSPLTRKQAWRLHVINPNGIAPKPGHYPTRRIAEEAARVILRAYP